jgi:2-iminobutanoate/2-iminopropanoate deaminase
MGTIVPGSFENEFLRSMENLRNVLLASGSDLQHVIQIRAYVRDPINLDSYNELYRKTFKSPYPARTTLTNCLPSSLQFEVECVAVCVKPK